MCEQWAEAYKSKGAIQSSRRSRTSSDPAQSRRSSVDAILTNNSTLSPQNKETPSKIFHINCLCAIQKPLLRHEVASEYVKKLGAIIDSHVKGVVEKEVEAILRKCGLSEKMPHFHSSNLIVGPPLSEIEDTSPASLAECLKAFFGLVLGSESSLPEFEQIQVPGLCSEASTQVARTLAEAYELIYNRDN